MYPLLHGSDDLVDQETGVLAPESSTAPRWTLRRVARVGLNTVLMVAIAFTLFVGYGLIDNRWYHVVEIYGSSMSPTILAGDAVVMVRPPQHIEPGMVLVFEVNGGVVTHRVVSVEPDGTFTTQGDANPNIDGWNPHDVEVVGRAVVRIPWLGRLLNLVPLMRGGRSAAYLADTDSVAAHASATEPPAAPSTESFTEPVTEPDIEAGRLRVADDIADPPPPIR